MTEYKRERPRLCTNAMDKPEIWDVEGHLAEALQLLDELMLCEPWEKENIINHIRKAWDKSE